MKAVFLVVMVITLTACAVHVRIEPLTTKKPVKRHSHSSQKAHLHAHPHATPAAKAATTHGYLVDEHWFENYIALEHRYNYWIEEDAEVHQVGDQIFVPRAVAWHCADMEKAANEERKK